MIAGSANTICSYRSKVISAIRNDKLKSILTWLQERFYPEDDDLEIKPQYPRPRVAPPRVAPRRVQQKPPQPKTLKFSIDPCGTIEDGGPGKNILMRNKYVREDTGTHETLKIVDESIVDSEEENGIDPYNTGRFDRSKSWQFRYRK